MPKKNYYAVKLGHRSNVIVKTWDECEGLVHGFSGARFKGFSTKSEAQQYLSIPIKVKKPAPKKPVKSAKLARLGYEPPYDRHGNPSMKPVHFRKNGVQYANFGRSIGKDHELLFDESDTSTPWV